MHCAAALTWTGQQCPSLQAHTSPPPNIILAFLPVFACFWGSRITAAAAHARATQRLPLQACTCLPSPGPHLRLPLSVLLLTLVQLSVCVANSGLAAFSSLTLNPPNPAVVQLTSDKAPLGSPPKP
eukprot:359744-Chlamydomonas_euryale.AAC.5